MTSNIFKKKFYLWWLSVLLIATSLFWTAQSGFITTIWETDITMITSITMLVFIWANALLGWISYSIDGNVTDNQKLIKASDTVWFLSEILMALGMLGTVIGLIHMLSSGLGPEQMQNMDSIQSSLGGMWKSMGLALYTNAVGIICSIVLKLQVHFIAGDLDEA